jgi:lysophospholipase L1-like esterase
MTRFLFFLLAALSACGTKNDDQPENSNTLKQHDFLALGDSYTIGEDVDAALNFPNQLAAQLRTKEGFDVTDPHIIAKTGWRTDELKTAIKNATGIRDSVFSIVTLCIGVNNQYQNLSAASYETEFSDLLTLAIKFAGGKPDHVFVLSIPDWAYTPYGQKFTPDPAKISQAIDAYNDYNRTLAGKMGVNYINVTDISRKAFEEPGLLASDDLHPSGQQYSRWVDLLRPEVVKVLNRM